MGKYAKGAKRTPVYTVVTSAMQTWHDTEERAGEDRWHQPQVMNPEQRECIEGKIVPCVERR